MEFWNLKFDIIKSCRMIKQQKKKRIKYKIAQ